MFSLTHLCRVDCIPLLFRQGHFLYKVSLVSFLSLPCFIEFSEVNANSVDPDQTPRSAEFDLDSHCLSVFLLWDTRLK